MMAMPELLLLLPVISCATLFLVTKHGLLREFGESAE